MTPASAIEKVNALLRLTQSENSHEAASAAQKMWAIARKYGLEIEAFHPAAMEARWKSKVEDLVRRRWAEFVREQRDANEKMPQGTRRATEEAACGKCGFWYRRGTILRRTMNGHWVHFQCPTITTGRVDNSTTGGTGVF